MDSMLNLLVNPDRATISDNAIAQVRAGQAAPAEPDPSFAGSDAGDTAESGGADDSGSDGGESEAPSTVVPAFKGRAPRASSREDVLAEKATLLFKLDRLEKLGERLSKRHTLADDIYELRTEVARLEKNRVLQRSIKFQRQVLVTIVSGIEVTNDRWDPIGAKLEGWSESVHESIANDEYDDVFAELAEKYATGAKMPPELRLVMMVAGSAFFCHMQNSVFKRSTGLESVAKTNPGLARDMAAEAAKNMAKQQAATNPLGAGLASMMRGVFSAPAPGPPPERPAAPGPDLEEIFSEVSADSVIEEIGRPSRPVVQGGSLVLDI